MKSGRKDISGRGSSTDKVSEVETKRSGWQGCSKQVGEWREKSVEARDHAGS